MGKQLLIRLKMVGNCVIPDLDDFVIYHGNDRIIDLMEYFTEGEIEKSLRHPKGGLRSMIDSGMIEIVDPASIDYKMQSRIDRIKEGKNNVANRMTIKQIIDDIKTLPVEKGIIILENEYFDNLSVLDKLSQDKSVHKDLREKAKEYMHKNLDKRIDQKFILI